MLLLLCAVACVHGQPQKEPLDLSYWNANFVSERNELGFNPHSAYNNFGGDASFEPSCTGKLRVCRNNETASIGGKQVCTPNKLGRGEVVYDAQNSPGSLYTGWLLQVILMEHMQIPFRFNDELGGALGMDFFHWIHLASQGAWSGKNYNWEALLNANQDPSCQAPLTAGAAPGCAHLMSEIWASERGTLDNYVRSEKVMLDLGPSGITGGLGWFMSKHHSDLFGGSTYRELNNESYTQFFGKPLTFGEYCKAASASATAAPERAAYERSMCAFIVDQAAGGDEAAKCDATGRSASAYFIKTISEECFVALEDNGFTTTISAAGQPSDPAVNPIHTSASTHEPLYAGKQDFTWGDSIVSGQKNVAHIVEAPCGWSTYYPVQIPTVHAHAVQYAFGDMVDLFSAMAWNTYHLLKEPKADWKGSTYLYPIISWWWHPDTMFEKSRFDRDPQDGELDAHWELQRVSLEPYSDECDAARREVFVKRYKSGTDFCKLGSYDLSYHNTSLPGGPGSWRAQCGLDPVTLEALDRNPCDVASCDYEAESFKMVAAASLPGFSPDTVEMLRGLSGKLSAADQGGWIGETDIMGKDAKLVLCEWINDNFDKGANWQSWLPDTFTNTGCRKRSSDLLCSGNGDCIANEDTRFAGSCRCADGWAGVLCESEGDHNQDHEPPSEPPTDPVVEAFSGAAANVPSLLAGLAAVAAWSIL